jgi:hypothetical protein
MQNLSQNKWQSVGFPHKLMRILTFYYFIRFATISPQAIFIPAFPAG